MQNNFKILKNCIVSDKSLIIDEDGKVDQVVRNCQDNKNGLNIDVQYNSVLKGRYLMIGGTMVLIHYGHHIIETISRWWSLFDQDLIESVDGFVLGYLMPTAPLAPNISMTIDLDKMKQEVGQNQKKQGLEWIIQFLLAFLDKKQNGKKLIWTREPTFIESLVIPDNLFCHVTALKKLDIPILSQVYQNISNYWSKNIFDKEPFERIYISRAGNLQLVKRQIPKWRKNNIKRSFLRRTCKNEDKVEQLFESFGFKVMYLERYPVPEQIFYMANVKIIAGFKGSGLHNILFCRPSTQIFVLDDDAIGGKTQHECNQIASAECTTFSGIAENYDRNIFVFDANLEKIEKLLTEKIEK